MIPETYFLRFVTYKLPGFIQVINNQQKTGMLDK